MKTVSRQTANATGITEHGFFSELDIRVSQVADLQNLSSAQMENFWTVATQIYFDAIANGHTTSELRKAIPHGLWQRLGIAFGKTELAIYRNFLRKVDRVKQAGSVADQRRTIIKSRAPDLSQDDRQALVQCAVNECAGQLDFAWQRCVKASRLSAAILKRYRLPSDRRPRCPKNIRRQVAYEVAELYKHHVRPHFNSNNVAPARRDWSNVYAQDAYESDDKTLDVRCVMQAADGTQKEIRPQFLPMIDQKSGCVLGFVLIGAAQYRAISIRTLIKKVCMEHGLPRSKFFFERGMWKNAALLGNNPQNKPFEEVENFAARCGIKIQHAQAGRARSKITETVLRLLDKKMYSFPGYTTRDEKLTERAKDATLFTFDELYSALENAIDDYNHTKSESSVKGGYYTPMEVWESSRRRMAGGEFEPVVKLTPEFEYLLAAHCEEAKLRGDGVKFTRSGELFHFRSDQLVSYTNILVGQRVKVWFDPAEADTAIVTDLGERQFFPAARVLMAPANAESSEDWLRFASATAPHRAKMRQIHERYSVIKMATNIPVRRVYADAIARDKAQRFSDAKEQAQVLSEKNKRAIRPRKNAEKRPGQQEAAKGLLEFVNNGNDRGDTL